MGRLDDELTAAPEQFINLCSLPHPTDDPDQVRHCEPLFLQALFTQHFVIHQRIKAPAIEFHNVIAVAAIQAKNT